MTLEGVRTQVGQKYYLREVLIASTLVCLRKRKLSISISKIIKQKDLRGVRTHVAKKYYTCKY